MGKTCEETVAVTGCGGGGGGDRGLQSTAVKLFFIPNARVHAYSVVHAVKLACF